MSMIATTQASSTLHVPTSGIETYKPLVNRLLLSTVGLFSTNRPGAIRQNITHKSFVEENILHPTLGPEISRTLRR